MPRSEAGTDRDRLAADLHEWTCRNWTGDHEPGQPSRHSLDFVACIPAADRLIALGWTRLDTVDAHRMFSWRCPECSTLVTSIVRPALDEERLARALTAAQMTGVLAYDSPDPHPAAAAIAKAYREDTE